MGCDGSASEGLCFRNDHPSKELWPPDYQLMSYNETLQHVAL
jgi:hypothetical protein